MPNLLDPTGSLLLRPVRNATDPLPAALRPPRDGDGDGTILDATDPRPAPSPPARTRDFGDPKAIRERIYGRVLHAARSWQPIQNQRHTLALESVAYEDPADHEIAEQKRAILEGRTLGRRLRGDWVLRDNATGAEVDRRRLTLATVPYITPRGTFIQGGNEYTLSHQLRLRPGVYTRLKENGELEAHGNVAGGMGHRVFLEPATGVFRLTVGQAKMPLVPLLKAMGVGDRQLMDRWGNELGAANLRRDDPSVIDKLHAKLVRPGDTSTGTRAQAVAEAFSRMQLDPEVMRHTLGKPYDRVSADMLLDVTDKLVAINKGEREPDDRDHLAYMSLHGPEDLIAERIGKDRLTPRKALWRASMAGSLRSVPTNLFNSAIQAAITGSGLGQPLESINPIQIYEQQGRVSRMGEGGIPSLDAIPDECYDAETEIFTATGWKSWPTVSSSDLLACRINGRLEFHPPSRIVAKPYIGPMYGISTRLLNVLVTPNHRHWCRKYRGGTSLARVGIASFAFELARDGFRRPREFQLTSEPWAGLPHDPQYVVPAVAGARRSYVFDLGDFAELLGWYLSEGSIDSYALRVRSKYVISISQDRDVNPENVRRIDALLIRMGIAHSYQGHNFIFVSKQLGVLLSAYGTYSEEKCIPECAFAWPEAARRRLYISLMHGDGSSASCGRMTYTTNSPQLREDVIRLACGLGLAARSQKPDDRNPARYDTRFRVSVLSSETTGVTSERMYDSSYYIVDYAGLVYCATVPGELLLVRRHGSAPIWSGNSRNVQPSHFGFIDPLVTPESLRVGVDSRIARNARKGDDGRIYAPFRDAQTGAAVWLTPQDVADAAVAFPGELESGRPYVAAMVGGRTQFVPRRRVRYTLPHMEDAFSPVTNMVPLKSAVKGQRAVMAGRMITQALPVEGAEAPLVQSGIPGSDNDSYEHLYGEHVGALRARRGGTVVSVSPDKIVLREPGAKADVEHQLYNNFPYNRKTYNHQTPTVRPGQEVRPGDLLARSNYTSDDGTTALGKNARVAYIPFRGLNFEDAIVVSEGFAKRMRSQHMYQHALELEEGITPGLRAHVSLFPGKYDRRMLANFDQDGAVKQGTVVHTGDPLVLAVKRREPSHSALHRGRTHSWDDVSVTWEHSTPGEVTDVVRTPRGVVVSVKTHADMEVGDKLCFDPSTWLLTRKGWKLVADIDLDDEIATLNQTTEELEYQKPTRLHHYAYDGPMYYLNTKHINMLVTPNHRLWVARPHCAFGPMRADEFYASGGEWQFKKDCFWTGIERPSLMLAHVGEVQADTWLEFLGYYLAEGWCAFNNANGQRTVKVAQFRTSPSWQKINDNLQKLGFRFRYNESDRRFEISDRSLYLELEPLGNSYTKRVPDYVQPLCRRQLRIFLDAYLAGDGHVPDSACWEYGSSSEGLAEDIQVICLKLGWSVTVKRLDRTDNWQKCSHWRGRINKYHLRPWWKRGRAKTYRSNTEGMVQYSGDVYCVTVPNHVIYCKREDKTYWSHNSGRYG